MSIFKSVLVFSPLVAAIAVHVPNTIQPSVTSAYSLDESQTQLLAQNQAQCNKKGGNASPPRGECRRPYNHLLEWTS